MQGWPPRGIVGYGYGYILGPSPSCPPPGISGTHAEVLLARVLPLRYEPVRKGTLVGRLVKQVVIGFHTYRLPTSRTHKQANGTRVFAVVPACVYMYRVSPKRPGVSVYGISAMRREAIRVRLDLPEH